MKASIVEFSVYTLTEKNINSTRNCVGIITDVGGAFETLFSCMTTKLNKICFVNVRAT